MRYLLLKAPTFGGLITHWRDRYTEGKLVEGKAANVKVLEAKINDLERSAVCSTGIRG